jgi:hypothetical protein
MYYKDRGLIKILFTGDVSNGHFEFIKDVDKIKPKKYFNLKDDTYSWVNDLIDNTSP